MKTMAKILSVATAMTGTAMVPYFYFTANFFFPVEREFHLRPHFG